jgi:EpsI family protein
MSRWLIAAAAAAFVLCYAGVIAGIVGTWSSNYLYSYGVAVPLISGYTIWAHRAALRRGVYRPDYLLGLPIVSVGMAMLIAGHLGALESLEQVSVIVTVFGAALLVVGRPALATLWFPIAYLMLAIPIWDRLISELQVPSQNLSAGISASLLRASGIPALHQNTLVILPNVTLQVLRECSGVNQLISVVTMTLPAAYLWLTGYARRIALLAIAVFVAYLSNGIRIALVGFLGYHGWSTGRVGTLHLLEGLAVSLVGYGMIFACLTALSRTRGGDRQSGGPARLTPTVSVRKGVHRVAWLDAVLVLLLLSAGAYRLTFRPAAVHLSANLAALPTQIGNWVADASEDSVSGYRLAGVDEELARTYRTESGERVRLYVGYHEYQREGKELSANVDRTAQAMPPAVDRSDEIGNQQGTPTEMLLWYDVNGRVITNLYLAKAYTVWDALTRGRSNGAVVAIEWNRVAGAASEPSREGTMRFADAVIPLLRQYLPSDNSRHALRLNVSADMP